MVLAVLSQTEELRVGVGVGYLLKREGSYTDRWNSNIYSLCIDYAKGLTINISFNFPLKKQLGFRFRTGG